MRTGFVAIASAILLLASPAVADLVSHWQFDNNLTDSVGGFNGTRVNTPVYVDGRNGGQALYVDGQINDVVVIPFREELNTESFTVSATVKIEQTGVYQAIFSSCIRTSPPAGYLLYSDNATPQKWTFWTATGTNWYKLNGPAVVYDAWTMVTTTYNADTGEQALFIDGIRVNTMPAPSVTYNTAHAFVIGGTTHGASYAYPFKGAIDEVRYYNRALSVSEVAALAGVSEYIAVTDHPESQLAEPGQTVVFTIVGEGQTDYVWRRSNTPDINPAIDPVVSGANVSGVTTDTLTITNVQQSDEGFYYCVISNATDSDVSAPAGLLTKRLISHWKFNNNLDDSIGGFDGDSVDFPVYVDGILDNGVTGKAVTIDSIYSVVEVPYTPLHNLETSTITGWMKVDGASSGWRTFISTRNIVGGVTSGSIVYVTSGNLLQFWTGHGTQWNRTGTINLATQGLYDEWVFFAATYDGSTHIQSLYVNGILDTSTNFSGTPHRVNTQRLLLIGGGQNETYPSVGYPFAGDVDDIRYYSYALSEDDVLQMYIDGVGKPAVTKQPPYSQTVEAGGTAYFDVAGVNVTGFAWHKAINPAAPNPAVDPLVGENDALTLSNVDLSSEGFYYCVLSNLSGYTLSDLSFLAIKRLVSQWDFEDTFADSVGGNNGTGMNGIGFSTSAVSGNKSLKLESGLEHYVTVPDSPLLRTNDFTISVWVKATAGSGGVYRGVLGKRTGVTPYAGYILYATPSNVWSFWTGGKDQAPTWHGLNGPAVMYDEWALVTMTFEKTGVSPSGILTGVKKLYVNGEVVAGQRTGLYYSPSDSVAFEIGKTSVYYFDGLIDDLRYYNYALSAVDIGQMYVDVMGVPMCIVTSEMNLNYDDKVDFADFAILAAGWLEAYNEDDLTTMAADWISCVVINP